MNSSRDTKTVFRPTLLAVAVALVTGPAGAEVYDLCATETLKPMPDGTQVPMWGYGPFADGACGAVQIPGPQLLVTDGTLTVNLHNALPEPTSLVIPGQALPPGGPTWDDGTTGRRCATAGACSDAEFAKRVRSFGAETAPGGTGTYTWLLSGPGTFVLHSGTHPQKQVYMGLYGSVVRDAVAVDTTAQTPAEIYPGVPYDQAVTLYYSDIDPDLNNAIACLYDADGTLGNGVDCATVVPYTTSVEMNARWFLVNGEPFDPAAIASPAMTISAGPANSRTLVRFLNAASETHVPVLQGLYATVHAEDGLVYSYEEDINLATGKGTVTAAPRTHYSVHLPPLKTKDAIVRAPTEGVYAVYDGNGYMTNPSDPNDFAVGDTVGGMLRFLSFGPPLPNRAPVAVADTAATANAAAVTIDVLANDADADGDTLSISAFDPVSQNGGTVSCATPSCTYTPAASFSGVDTFTYTVSDGTDTGIGTVTVTVAAPNTPPVARDDSYTTAEGTVLNVAAPGVLGNDTDAEGNALTASVATGPGSGVLVLNPNGSFTYAPNTGFAGSDSFTYAVSDGQATATATVSITVTAAPNKHVGDLDGTASINNASTWQATVTVTVHDQDDAPLAGVVVGRTWSPSGSNGGSFNSANCTTNAQGQCQLSRRFSRSTVSSATMTVTNLSLAGAAYVATKNHDPDGDSNGTAITIARP